MYIHALKNICEMMFFNESRIYVQFIGLGSAGVQETLY